MKILFIGNSYTYFYDLPQMFEKLARENGKDVCVTSLTVGGRELHQNLNPQDEQYAELVAYLQGGRPDALFLQEQSVLPAVNQDLFLTGVQGLCDLISPARSIMYATWGRKEGSETLKIHGWTTQDMAMRLYHAYSTAAEVVGGSLSPVGLCFLAVGQAYPHIDLYDPDLSHPSLCGSVLATLCHYYTLFGELPAVCDSLGVDAPIIDAFKAVIAQVCEK